MEIPFNKKTGNRRFSIAQPPAKLSLLIGNQRVLGVVGLPVGECFNVELLFVVLWQVIFFHRKAHNTN